MRSTMGRWVWQRCPTLAVVAITEDDLANARGKRSYWVAVWLGRLYLVLAVGWVWLLFGVRPVHGLVIFLYWLAVAVLVVIAQVLLSHSGIPFLPRFLDWRRENRWVEWAFYRDVLSLRRG
jgi:hypothetical protein